jgi:hypothetical protein
MSDEEKQILKTADVSVGDVMASFEFFQVVAKNNALETLSVKDLNTGLTFDIRGDSLVAQCVSADRFFVEKKVTRTEMASILSESFNMPFTAVFDKAKGEERTLRGKLVKVEALMGRARVIDFDLPYEIGEDNPTSRQRLVDFRTLKSLIVGGVKYTLKGK